MSNNQPEPSLAANVSGSALKDNNQLFARKLRELRTRIGLTQEQFAEAAFCSSDHVNKMERGLRLPSPQLLQTMNAAFQKAGLDKSLYEELENLLLASKFGEQTGAVSSSPVAPVAAPPAPSPEITTLPAASTPGPGAPEQLFGRAESIEKLVELYRQGLASPVVIISGLGGIGKSAVAAEIARQVQPLFGGVVHQTARRTQLQNGSVIARLEPSGWLDEAARPSFENLAAYLGKTLAVDADLGEILRREKFLLVLDSLEECEEPVRFLTGLERLLQNGPSKVLITSRTVPANFEGYHLHLGALEPEAAIEFFRQEGLRRNLPPLLEESPEARLVLQSTIEHTGGHPQAMKFVAHRLGTFSLGRIMDDLGRTYPDVSALARHPAGGLYCYLYRADWLKLSDPARRLLAAMQDWPGKIEESRLVSLGGPGVDLALDELVAACFVEVRGGFVKNYALHPLTYNLLKTGLTAFWEQEG